MRNKLISWGIGLVMLGGLGVIASLTLETILREPIYMLLMKAAAGVFGVGGGLLGLSSLRRKGK